MRQIIGIGMAIALGGILGFAIHDVTQYDRTGSGGGYECPNTIVHDFVHPAHRSPGLKGLAFDDAPPCNRQARVHVFGWIGLMVAIIVSWVLSVTLIPRIAVRPADDDAAA